MKGSKSECTPVFTASLIVGMLLLSMPGLLWADPATPEIRQGHIIFRGGDRVVLDVPYVPTEDFIINEMFKLVRLRASDILYDLGCGDGRIVIRAVKKVGARGVGVDIDPTRIAESKAKAIAAGVADRTTFLQQDLFQSDIGDATVVTLFLLHEINMKLRPKLFSELKPGTRIVSHNFDMGDWTPDKSSSLGLWEDGFHTLYSWVIPANVSGSWSGQYKNESLMLVVNQKLQKIGGTLVINRQILLPISEAEVSGEQIRFVARSQGQGRVIVFEGNVKGNALEGILKEEGAKGEPWSAIRDPSTLSWIE
jgi:SAM-dependent methyltransferase